MKIHRTTCAVFGVLSLLLAVYAQSSPDLSTYVGTTEKISSCSLIIPMDDAQGSATDFNLKSYGLINSLLYNNIPVKWVIKSGKTKVNGASGVVDEADFSATVTQVLPTASDSPTTKDFKSGAFVIPALYCEGSNCVSSDDALAIISSYGNNVAVYKLSQSVDMEVRYTLNKKPLIGLLNDGGMAYIHRAILLEAGFVECESASCPTCPSVQSHSCHFYVMSANASLASPSSSCLSTMADAGFRPGYPQAVPYVAAVRSFVLSGGNLFAEGGAISTYEMCDPVDGTRPMCSAQYPNDVPQYFLTSDGLQVLPAADGASNNITYIHADTPLEQFYGPWGRVAAGTVPQYRLYKSTSLQSTLVNNGYHHIGMDNTQTFISSQAKIGSGVGSNVFYLAGSNYCNTTATYASGDCAQSRIGNQIAGVRLFLNAMLIPANRSAECGLDVVVPSTGSNTCGCSMQKDSNNQCCLQTEIDTCGVCFGNGTTCAGTTGSASTGSASTGSATTGSSTTGNTQPTPSVAASSSPSTGATTGRNPPDNQVSSAVRGGSISLFTILAVAILLAL